VDLMGFDGGDEAFARGDLNLAGDHFPDRVCGVGFLWRALDRAGRVSAIGDHFGGIDADCCGAAAGVFWEGVCVEDGAGVVPGFASLREMIFELDMNHEFGGVKYQCE